MIHALFIRRLCPPGGKEVRLSVLIKPEMKVITSSPRVIIGDLDEVLHNDPFGR